MNNPFKFEKPQDSLKNLFGAPKEQLIREIPIGELNEITEQPFNAYSDDALDILVDDIRENGLLSPLVVAPITEGGYEIIAGRNRYRACKKLGIEKIPCVIRNNLNAAKRNLILVASNLMQRQKLLPSEKAKAYKMHKDACDELKIKFKPDLLESSANVYKYLRLNALLPEIMQMLDNEEITFSIGYEIAGLNANSQKVLYNYLQNGNSVSLNGVTALKDFEKSDAQITEQIIELCEAINPFAEKNSNIERINQPYNNESDYSAQNSSVQSDFIQSQQTVQSTPNVAHNQNIDVLENINDSVVDTDKFSEAVNEVSAFEQTEINTKVISETNNDSDCDDSLERVILSPGKCEIDNKELINEIVDKSDNETLTIERNELPWTLKNNCDMNNLKTFILSKLPKLSQEYFDCYPLINKN